MLSSVSRTRLLPALLCAITLGTCIFVSDPRLEIGVNDDWCYIWIAKGLAHTGHMTYNGWATPVLGWQAYLGALCIKLFGFSFTAVRSSVLLVSMCTAVLLQRLFVKFGVNEWNATIATLMLALSPVMLPLSFSFMSDMPGLFSLLLCFYLCAMAVKERRDGVAAAFISAAAVLNLVGGTARQIAWLGVLVVVPSALWLMRRRKLVLYAGTAAWILSCLGVLAVMRWASVQPYFLTEKLLVFSFERSAMMQTAVELIRSGIILSLLLLPILAGFALRCRLNSKALRRDAALLGLAVLSFAITLIAVAHVRLTHHLSVREITPFFNNMLTARGAVDVPGILGQRPEVIPLPVRIGLLVLTAAAVAACGLSLRGSQSNSRPESASPTMPAATLWMLLGPYSAAYLLIIIIHGQIYDRYLIPLFLVAAIWLVRLYQDRVATRLPGLSIALVIVIAAFSTVTLHDLFALDRARLTEANQIIASGVPRSQLRAGFEYDGWTQLELKGFLNDERIHAPAGAYRPIPEPSATDLCAFWFTEHTPEVKARFGLSYQSQGCGLPAFKPVSYHTWLPPREQWIYVRQLPQEPVLQSEDPVSVERADLTPPLQPAVSNVPERAP